MAEILQGKKFSAQGGPASGWKCAFCKGSGVQPRSLKSRCFACRGKGEVKFESSAITCPSCKGKGRVLGSAIGLACIRCKGVGVVEKGSLDSAWDKEAADVLGERLREITKRLSGTRKKVEEKTKEIEKRLKPLKPVVKEVKKETAWIKKLGNKIKKSWQSLWKQ